MPPSAALKIWTNKTINENATAFSFATPKLNSKNTITFSLTPSPPIDMGIPINTNMTGTMNASVIKLISSPKDMDTR